MQNEAKAHILKHVNVVTLYGMIFEPNHYGVVLEFIPHGCLDDFIYKYKVLFNLLYLCELLLIIKIKIYRLHNSE